MWHFVYLYPLIQSLIQKPVLEVSVECVSPLSVNDIVLCVSVSCNPILDQKSVITHTHVISICNRMDGCGIRD